MNCLCCKGCTCPCSTETTELILFQVNSHGDMNSFRDKKFKVKRSKKEIKNIYEEV